MVTDSNDRLVGTVLDDRYRIQSRIARGGMAKVYLAQDIRLERLVAIKIMHDHLADDTDYAARFIREARHTARLAHPNIMSVFDQGHVDDTLYLVMEYLPGMTLRDLLNDFGTLTVEQSLDIATAVLHGLSVAHREGILHRDVKPENVILVNDGRIKIGDFGLARPVNNATDTGKSLMGTVAYIAPELLTRTSADNRSDLYSVGIMLYEMLTGRQPFIGDTPMQVAVQHAQEPMPFAAELNPTVSRAVDDVIQWATQKEPTDRPRDARTMLDALTQALKRPESVTDAPTTVIDTARAPESIEDERETQQTLPRLQPDRSPGARDSVDHSMSPLRPRRGLRIATILVTVLVLLGGGGSTWWFLYGPGAVTASATVLGMTEDAATAALTTAGFVVVPPNSEEYNTEITEGLVITTSPEITAGMPKGTEVHLVVSLGPEPIAFPNFDGITTVDFSSQLAKLGISVVDTAKEFHKSISAGTVIAVTTVDGSPIAAGDTVYAGESVIVTESVGTIPSVKGMTIEQATATLATVDLTVKGKSVEEFSASIAAGRVISVSSSSGVIRPGGSVSLVISKGPELVAVPAVSGLTIAAAQAALEELGFTVTVVTEIPKRHWAQSWAEAGSTDPNEGTMVPKGSTVTLRGLI
ncbi:MAG: Stk1 family PASTA domain-containing Ser/Thr kinase [Microbacteriaceae bacterium]|nr:Stk1 family PASTA domain-containing Ser/Thr kinase [Microbacteriaceae bacterium]